MYDLRISHMTDDERLEVESFLSAFGLLLDKNTEYTFVARVGEKIAGTCSIDGKVIKCFAVSKELQGQGVGAQLVTHAVNFLFDRGIYESFVFTMPKNKGIFEDMGFREVYFAENAVLLEGGRANVKRSVKEMFAKSGLDDGEKAALVMNCNPFTLGHRYLIEKAASENRQVVVFIVKENKSAFPYEARYDLAKRGTEDIKNVAVIPGGDYIISSATFPTYFLKKADDALRTYTQMDAGIFGKYIAPVFNIKRRYAGTEPYDEVTAAYNNALAQVMPMYGIEFRVEERMSMAGGAVSASNVRRLMEKGSWDEIKNLVPDVTYRYLVSLRGK